MLDESRKKLDETLASASTLEEEEALRQKVRQNIYKNEHANYLLAELDKRERLRSSASITEQMEINRSAASAARDAADAAREANELARAADRHAKVAATQAKIANVIAAIALIVAIIAAVLSFGGWAKTDEAASAAQAGSSFSALHSPLASRPASSSERR